MIQSHKSNSPRKENYLSFLLVGSDDMRAYLTRCLSASDFHILNIYGSRDAEEALQMIAAHVIDVVVSDVVLAKRSGIELCKKIKSEDSVSPPSVLLISGGEVQKIVREASSDSILRKPFNAKRLQHQLLAMRQHGDLENSKCLVGYAKDQSVLVGGFGKNFGKNTEISNT